MSAHTLSRAFRIAWLDLVRFALVDLALCTGCLRPCVSLRIGDVRISERDSRPARSADVFGALESLGDQISGINRVSFLRIDKAQQRPAHFVLDVEAGAVKVAGLHALNLYQRANFLDASCPVIPGCLR
jgi:hypothetical protein